MNNLEKIRAIHGLTQAELGAKIGHTRAMISALEKGRISVRNADKIASVLNENVFDVMGSDVLKKIPTTQEDKDKLIAIISNIKVS